MTQKLGTADHGVCWPVDGVPVPNTNIAGTVGPQFDSKDIDPMEIQRGGYSAEVGDRTYGVFNVVPRSGCDSEGGCALERIRDQGNQRIRPVVFADDPNGEPVTPQVDGALNLAPV
jgi:hypothetical protein